MALSLHKPRTYQALLWASWASGVGSALIDGTNAGTTARWRIDGRLAGYNWTAVAINIVLVSAETYALARYLSDERRRTASELLRAGLVVVVVTTLLRMFTTFDFPPYHYTLYGHVFLQGLVLLLAAWMTRRRERRMLI